MERIQSVPKSFKKFNLPWRTLPSAVPNNIEIFVIGDVHGQAAILKEVLDTIKATPTPDKTRHLVFLGDLIDRGPESIRAVSLAMDAERHAEIDVLHVLPGNHDILLVNVDAGPGLLGFWSASGGHTVLSEIGMTAGEDRYDDLITKLRQALHPDYISTMDEGPTHLFLGDLLFVHAGIHPDINIPIFLAEERYDVLQEPHWATIRYPFLNWKGGWDRDDPDLERRRLKPTIVIHGHTPALRRQLTADEDLSICDGVDEYRTLALDIGAAYRPQLCYAHIRSVADISEVQINGIAAV